MYVHGAEYQKNDHGDEHGKKRQGKYEYGKKRTTTGAACDENPICHAELRSFIGYESFKRPSAPQAKVNTHTGEKATRHRDAFSEHEGVSLHFTDGVLFVDRQQQVTASIIHRVAVE